MNSDSWHHYAMAQRHSLPNQKYTNDIVEMLKPDRPLSNPHKVYDNQFTPDFFGSYNGPMKGVRGCGKAKSSCNKSK